MSLSTCCRLLVALLLLSYPLLVFPQNQPRPTPQDTLRLMAEEEQRRLADPATGTVPYERLDAARHQLNNRSVTATGALLAQSGIPNITWQERGPSNVGGRTRALLFDPNDPAHKKVWAGSLAGGLWYTNDITDANAGWTPVSDTWENMVVTTIAADPSNPQVMYAGTGDAYNYVTGGGIWKTTNGGTTWTRLTSTIPTNNYPAISYSFGYIQQIVVNSSGQVFAATQLGVVRSTDGGTSWQYVLAPNQSIGVTGSTSGSNFNDLVTDLELAADGILYAGFNPSRVFKSTTTAGTSWTEITPAGTSGGERTELALALSTSGASQVIYAVSRAYNNTIYNQDIKWFKKSNNGGVTWTDVTIPVFSWGAHFTTGNGDYALNLAVHPSDANTLYAGGYNWFRSIDGGSSWSSPLTNTYLYYYYALLFSPGSTQSAVYCNDKGVFWSSNWNDASLTQPTILDRNNGYRVNETNSVAMKSSPGSAYLLGTSRSGAFKLTANGLSSGSVFYTNSYDMGLTFIDDDSPASQVFHTGGSIYLYNETGTQYLAGINTSFGGVDYDSQTNTLYAADYNFTTSQNALRRITGIGSSITTTLVPLTGVTNSLSYLKLSKDRTALFAGSYPSKLYKITNLDQASPTVMAIDNGALPQYTNVSCIDIGANDNELLVTLSNFGVQSVWYTNDGGQSWVGRDQSNYGLPDVPVRAALFNPQNRKQVLLATDAGIWSTTDITAANPGWAFSGTGMGTFRVNQLRYRASDGRIAAATYGRGIWTTDAFAIPYTSSTITLTGVSNSTLCAGNAFTVSFTTAGSAFTTENTFEVWLSDATGSFTNARKIGSGTTSPITVTLPNGYYNAIPYGKNYRLKVVAPAADIESGLSDAIAIGNLLNNTITDRRGDSHSSYTSGTICPNSRMTITVQPRDAGYYLISAESYQWLLNGNPISGATSQTISAVQAGNYQAIIRQAGCTVQSDVYQLSVSNFASAYVISPVGTTPQCDDRQQTLNSGYLGETATYQWTFNGVNIIGATSSTFSATQSGAYSFQMTDGNCSATAPPQTLNFGKSLYAQAYLSSDADSVLCPNSYSYKNIYAAQISSDQLYNGTYSIQWYRNNVPLLGYNYTNYRTNQPGIYTFELKQGNCATRSNGIVIKEGALDPPIINYSYYSKTACLGEIRYLYNQNSSAYSSFQWQKDGIDIPGATSYDYSAQTSGSYTVRITTGSCQATSLPVSLTFSNTIEPVINYYSNSSESCSGTWINAYEPYQLAGYQYQWMKNGVVISTQTSSYFYAGQSGVYTVRVTNGSCSGISKGKYINTMQATKPVIYINRSLTQLCTNNSLQLMANNINGSLQWKRNGIIIPDANYTNFYATQSGLYSVAVQDGSCTAESDPVEVKIGEATTATLSGNALITAGQSTKLPISFTGPAPWSVSLTNGQSLTATYQNPAFITVSPTANTTHQLASVINACGTGTTSGQASVSVGTGSADVSLNMALSNRSPNVGDLVSVRLTATNAGPDNAQGVQLSSLLPAGLAFVSSPSAGVIAANGLVTANLGTIPANGQTTIRFLVSPTLPGTFATTTQITATQTPDPDSQPNSGTGDGQDDAASVDLRTTASGSLVSSPNPNQLPLPKVAPNQPATDPNTADLSLAMQVDKLSPSSSELISTSITVSNRGGSSASSIVVELVLPNGAASPVSQVNWVGVSGPVYKGYINQLAAGQSATLVFTWQPTGSGTLKAQILDMYEADSDSTPGNGYAKGEDDEATLSIRVR